MSTQIQVIRRGEHSWEVIRYSDLPSGPNGERVFEAESIALIALSIKKDRYEIWRADWSKGGTGPVWSLIQGRSYLTRAAALRSITHPGAAQ